MLVVKKRPADKKIRRTSLVWRMGGGNCNCRPPLTLRDRRDVVPFAPPSDGLHAGASAAVRDNILLGLPEKGVDLPIAIRLAVLERDLAEFERPDSTCLVVSHRRPALRRADHIILLHEGKVEAEGKLDALLETSAEMQRLWRGELEPNGVNEEG